MAADGRQVKKSRLRASDLHVTGDWNVPKTFDFTRIPALKGTRNPNLHGRPSNVAESSSRKRPIRPEDQAIIETASVADQTWQEPTGTLTLTLEELYRDMLLRQGGFHCLSDNRTFVVLDYSAEMSSLTVNKYVFLKRRACNFGGEWKWAYTCSCDDARRELVNCLSVNVDISFEDFVMRNPGCLHTAAVETLVEEFDTFHCIIPDISGNAVEEPIDHDADNEESSPDQNVIALGTNHFYVISEKGPGVIEQSGNISKCVTCNSCKDIFSQLSSGVLHCPKCNSHAMAEVPVVMKSVLLVMVSGTAETEVSVKRCPQCKFVLGIDGKAAGFINLGHYMVCHEVLRRYLYYFFSGRSTLFTEYQVLKKYTEDYGDRTFGDKFSYTYFKWAWYSFLDLLDINFEEGFFCPDCGDYPDSFVMDATSVSFRKELACWSSLASEKRKPPKPPSAKEKKLRRDERALLPLSVREPFSMLVKKGGLLKDMIPMIMSLVSQDCPNYAGLLQTIIDCAGVKEDRLFVAHPWEDFAKCLVSPYPACSFITTDPAVHSVLRRLNRDTRGNMHDLSILQHNIPSLFQLLQELKDNFPYSAMQKVTDTMIGRSMAPFGKSNEVTEGMEMDTTENISYFPTMKVVRGRGLYSCDKDIGKAKECSKMSRGHPSLLPGIFTLFCTHGVCYGFEVMKYHESPNLPFTILRSRCKEAPSLVVYDNACNLHQYCINRDPDFFKNTTFRVDALHFKNHKACGTSYKLKAYPQHKKLNSQVVEQANSRIQRIKSQLSYMTQTNFVNHCKLFLWAQNKAAIQK